MTTIHHSSSHSPNDQTTTWIYTHSLIIPAQIPHLSQPTNSRNDRQMRRLHMLVSLIINKKSMNTWNMLKTTSDSMRNILYNNYLVDQDQLSLRNNGCNISYKHNYEHKAKSTYSEHPLVSWMTQFQWKFYVYYLFTSIFSEIPIWNIAPPLTANCKRIQKPLSLRGRWTVFGTTI